MLKMRPYRVIMKGVSPVVLSGFAPSLDGILYEALSQVLATESPEIIRSRLREILLFNEETGVFHASSLTCAITPEQGVSAAFSIRCDCLRSEKLSSTMFRPRMYQGKFPRLYLQGGPTKKRLTSRPAYAAPWYSFDFFGAEEPVQHLLTQAHVGIGYDFFSAANGEFTDVSIIPLAEDSSIDAGGSAARPVPAKTGLQGLHGFSPLVPPYFSGEKEPVIYPEPLRIQLTDNLL
ncbi:TPA: hypothetical protein JGU28_004493 [Salmonella enterica]|nr:hypothetical protein [Salmonella enterica]